MTAVVPIPTKALSKLRGLICILHYRLFQTTVCIILIFILIKIQC